MGPVTVSIGLAITPLHCPPDRLVRTADAALLREGDGPRPSRWRNSAIFAAV